MIAVTYLEGWMLAHPAWFLIFLACCAVAAVFMLYMHAENRRDDREGGLPEAPRRGTRSRARGTRARRHAFLGSARRRAGTMITRARRRFLAGLPCRRARAWVTSWFWWCGAWHPWQAARERIALRARGITIDVTGDPTTTNVPGREEDGTDPKPQPAASTMGPRAASPGEPSNPAGGLTRQQACPRCGAAHKEPHCAGGREWGPFPGPETPGNGCGQPRTPPNGCEFPPGPPHGLPVSGPGGATGPARLATGAGQPRQQETPPGGYGRALEPWRGPRLHYAAGLCWCGQYHDQREPARLATGAERDAAEAAATRPWADDTGAFTRICAEDGA